MPFGKVAEGEFGTYFIGYSRSPSTIEEMLQNMFVGNPPGNYDRILDFSRAVTGNLFFVPPANFLDDVSEDTPEAAPTSSEPASETSAERVSDGSLGIGSLKGESTNE
jgi:putative iron-dependent peroxidase